MRGILLIGIAALFGCASSNAAPGSASTGGHLSLMRMHAVEQTPDLTNVVPDAPPKLEAAVRRAMRKEPAERPTAAQLGTMLRELLQEMRPSSRFRRLGDLTRA